jgi:hypothetical protein
VTKLIRPKHQCRYHAASSLFHRRNRARSSAHEAGGVATPCPNIASPEADESAQTREHWPRPSIFSEENERDCADRFRRPVHVDRATDQSQIDRLVLLDSGRIQPSCKAPTSRGRQIQPALMAFNLPIS